VYDIRYAEGVADDLADLRSFDRTRILDRIEEQLKHQPDQPTRNRKELPTLTPPWEHVPPVWELRIGEHRVFYDIDEKDRTVTIRAIRHKPPNKTTEEIL
jgi:mRNA-degrading endonuclease RelE of RelBE toxin-antitoxin system